MASFEFYDPYSGNTLYYTLYCNYADDAITDNYTALYESYYMVNEEGGYVIMPTSRTINISNGENPSALGKHEIVFSYSDGVMTVKIDSARATTISSLGSFSVSSCVCTVAVPEGTADGKMALTLNYYEGTEVPDVTPGPGGDDDDKPDDNPGGDTTDDVEKGGCGGAVVGTGTVAGGALLLAGIAVLMKKRSRSK